MISSRQGGVTMIEAAVAVVTLAMVAAFAVPRYAGLQTQARVAALHGLSGSVRSAANMGHGVWMASGNVSPIVIDGKKIAIVNGYPDAAGIQTLIEDAGFAVKVSASTARFTPNGARVPAGCALQYGEAAAFGSSFTVTYPTQDPSLQSQLLKSC